MPIMSKNAALGDVSLVEQTYQAIYDNRGNVARPTILLLARGAEPLETCDAAQRALRGENGEAYAIGGHVTVDNATGAIERFQWMVVAIDRECRVQADLDALSACNADFPRCTEYRRCARLFPGTRRGLRDALQHAIAQYESNESASNAVLLRAALVETERLHTGSKAPQSNGGTFDLLQCINVQASARDAQTALQRDRLTANSATTEADRQAAAAAAAAAAEERKKEEARPCGACGSSQVVASLAREAIAKQRIRDEAALRRRCERYAMLALAMILLTITILAVVLAVRSGRARAAHKAAERKLDLLLQSALRRPTSRA